MSNTPNRASNPAPKPRRKDAAIDLDTARAMLPLVRGILTDVRNQSRRLGELLPEQERLERHRRELTWAERTRRYAIQDEITASEKGLAAATAELEGLGVTLVDAAAGEVDFPARVNGRSAAYHYVAGEPTLGHWHYTGDDVLRPIPDDWQTGTPVRSRT